MQHVLDISKTKYLANDQLDSIVGRRDPCIAHPDGTYELYTYNGRWEVAAYINAAGHTTSYEYDAMSRVTTQRDALGLASCIPGIGAVASAVDAWYYYREGNTSMAMACTVDAVIGLFGVTGSLLQLGSKTRRAGKAIQIVAKIGNGGIGLY